MRIPPDLARPLPWWVDRSAPLAVTVPGPFALRESDGPLRGVPQLGCLLRYEDDDDGWVWQNAERNRYLGTGVELSATENRVFIDGGPNGRITLDPVSIDNVDELLVTMQPGEEPWQAAWRELTPVWLIGQEPSQFGESNPEGALPMPDDQMPVNWPWPQG